MISRYDLRLLFELINEEQKLLS